MAGALERLRNEGFDTVFNECNTEFHAGNIEQMRMAGNIKNKKSFELERRPNV